MSTDFCLSWENPPSGDISRLLNPLDTAALHSIRTDGKPNEDKHAIRNNITSEKLEIQVSGM